MKGKYEVLVNSCDCAAKMSPGSEGLSYQEGLVVIVEQRLEDRGIRNILKTRGHRIKVGGRFRGNFKCLTHSIWNPPEEEAGTDIRDIWTAT